MPDSPFAQLSDSLAAVVESVAPSVVRVEARRRGNASGVAWSADGLVIASDHTVQRDEDLRLGLPSGDVVEAELVGRDPATDLALLRADTELAPPEWAEADTVRVGHLALSIGRHDEGAQTALGVVEQRGGAWRTGTGGRVDAFVHTGIRVYPGFSGSAVADAHGRVVGLGTSWFGRRAALALPVGTLRRVAEALQEHGHVPHGFLGVSTQPVRLRDGAAGLLVLDVTEDGPAEAAGVLVGDVIVGVGGEPVQGPHDLVAALADAAGQTRTLDVVRGGERQAVEVEIGSR
ncbi:S1C family serine protease [Rubrivirga marina]|uniref:PDZ domain-containing protein n=1 Tax=Rubrivirga marina TaxID=1196024 RepID=A0A271IX76_9BACT|nr:S1C family serine protease [Rubrivirga marina]PAP75687.1 hypothetical protein BSZ37_04170 [Rubrivirga marina]